MTNQEAIELAIKACEETWNEKTCKQIRDALEQEPSGDLISRQAVLNTLDRMDKALDTDRTVESYKELLTECYKVLPSVKQEPKTGHWMRKTKVDGVYDIAGVKTWGIKCQCDRCDFSTIVVEDFGYYKYCPNCGAKMESEEQE